MKIKILSLILVCCLLIVGCTVQSQLKAPAKFYYCASPISYHSSDGLIASEIRETILINSDLKSLLNGYLAGPVSKDLSQPFPANLMIEDISISDGIASIVLSEELSKLTGIDLTIACSCLCLTVMDYTGVDLVELSIVNNTISGKQSMRFTRDSLVLLDTATITQSDR